MKSSINLAMFFLLAIASALPAGYCQDAWIVLPEVSGNQIGYLSEPTGVALDEPIGIFPSEGEQLPTATIIPQQPIFYGTGLPNAPSELRVGKWDELGSGGILGQPSTYIGWNDNSNNELGFKIYNGTDLLETTSSNVTILHIPLPISCGNSVTLHVTAYNENGESAPINVTIDGLCPPNTQIRNECTLNQQVNYDISGYTYTVVPVFQSYGDHATAGALYDIHVILETESRDYIYNVGDDIYRYELVYHNYDADQRLLLDPPCIGSLMVYAIPKNAAGEGNSTNVLHLSRSEKDDPACIYYPEPERFTTELIEFSVGKEDSYEKKIYVYKAGTIRAEATWTGTATNLELAIEGPSNYDLTRGTSPMTLDLRTRGTSPMTLGHSVTGEDLIKGDTWTISIINNDGGKATGTIKISYPVGHSLGGTWDTNWGRMEILLYPDRTFVGNFTGTDDLWENRGPGKIEGNFPVFSGFNNPYQLSGRWEESPSPIKYGRNKGTFFIYMSPSGDSFTGFWKNDPYYYSYLDKLNRQRFWDGQLRGTWEKAYVGPVR